MAANFRNILVLLDPENIGVDTLFVMFTCFIGVIGDNSLLSNGGI